MRLIAGFQVTQSQLHRQAGMLMGMLLWLVDSWRLWHGAKKGIRARYPNAPLRGLWAYLNNRAMTVRRWRNPEPRIERGEKIH